MNKKYILFIGMGDWDIPQLELAKQAGFLSIVTNRDMNSLALSICDIPIKADGQDIYGILSALYELGLEDQIAHIYSGTELFTTVAVIAKTLGISWHSPYSAYVCEKKHLMRKAFEMAGLSVPKGQVASSAKDVQALMASSKNTFIVKPSDSLSSQGVRIVDKTDDIAEVIEYSLQYSKLGKVVCEEYIEGTLHDINGILTPAGLIRLGINDKVAGPLPYAVVVEVSAPTSLISQQEEELYQVFEAACRAVGLSLGPVKGDVILSKDGVFYVMEVAPRLHGPLGSLYMIPLSLGVNPMEALFSWLKKSEFKVHEVGQQSTKSILCQAKAVYKEDEETQAIIKVLRKSGIADESKWTSNADVPIYLITKGSWSL